MEIELTEQELMSKEDRKQFMEFKRVKRLEDAIVKVSKIECDCLSEYAEKSTLKQLCKDAQRLALGAIVVFPYLVKSCVSYLGKDPQCSLIAAISYPHGGDDVAVKAAAVKKAICAGADEVEIYPPLMLIKDNNFAYLKKECKKLVKSAKKRAVRLVIDVNALSRSQLIKACSTAADAGIDCIRLCGTSDFSVIKEVKSAVRDKCLMKIDGVETAAALESAIDYGASSVSSKSAVELASLLLSQANE